MDCDEGGCDELTENYQRDGWKQALRLGNTYAYMLLSYCSCSCLPEGGTMAGWGIPVGCMPDGPSIREWGNLVQVKEISGGEETKKWVQTDAVAGGLRGKWTLKQEHESTESLLDDYQGSIRDLTLPGRANRRAKFLKIKLSKEIWLTKYLKHV